MDQGSSSKTGRGKGTCPRCNGFYVNRYKPENCQNCGFELGGNYVPKKKPRLEVPKSTLVLQSGQLSLYSVNTSTHDDRCIVIVNANASICEHRQCKQSRASLVNSMKSANFSCEHLRSTETCITSPSAVFNNLPDLPTYLCDDSTRKDLMEITSLATESTIAVKVSPTMYCVFGKPTTNNPSGYCHVRVTDKEIRCCSKDCKTIMARAKQLKSRKMCTHVHILLCLGIIKKDDNGASNTLSSESPIASTHSESSEHVDNNPSSQARNATIELNMRHTLPYCIPSNIVKQAGDIDSINGWPDIFYPSVENCQLCNSILDPSKPHPRTRGNSVLITHLNPFKVIKVHVKSCPNCLAMHQVFPYQLGLFNICDKVMVSFDILLEWRHLFRKGVPISIAIQSKLNAFVDKVEVSPATNELENIANHLYNGFYCFEAITERDLDSVLCGICGITGEVYFGDGNEKNCCNISEIDYSTAVPDQSTEGPIPLEDFLGMLKRRWIECTTYTRCQKFNVKVSDVPPVMAPAIIGNIIYNTEHEKNSVFLKQYGMPSEGDPALLHQMICNEDISMTQLKNYSVDELRELCSSCGISTSQKSQERMRIDLQTLYETLLVGYSPCHGFTQVKGHTGGFYHVVCRHGVTAASKFLTIKESVRDAADLYLSFKHIPLAFLCDTPCGFVRHLGCRAKEVTEQLWGKFCGCFEEPSLEKSPATGINVPALVTSEYRAADKEMVDPGDTIAHPLTGMTRRYVLGDRFHAANNPHKSPLCRYHDINLLQQSNTIKTSYQESENNRKNVRRLRSSCMQNFSTHYFYNYLMDFYQNEEIVKKQKATISKILKPNEELIRDTYMRFIVKER